MKSMIGKLLAYNSLPVMRYAIAKNGLDLLEE